MLLQATVNATFCWMLLNENRKTTFCYFMDQTQMMRWIKSGKMFVYVNEEVIKKPKTKYKRCEKDMQTGLGYI